MRRLARRSSLLIAALVLVIAASGCDLFFLRVDVGDTPTFHQGLVLDPSGGAVHVECATPGVVERVTGAGATAPGLGFMAYAIDLTRTPTGDYTGTILVEHQQPPFPSYVAEFAAGTSRVRVSEAQLADPWRAAQVEVRDLAGVSSSGEPIEVSLSGLDYGLVTVATCL